MLQPTRLAPALLAVALVIPAAAAAQMSPAPSPQSTTEASPAPATTMSTSTPSTMSTPSSMQSSPAPAMTMAPNPNASSAPRSTGGGTNAKPSYKKLKSGTLTTTQTIYGLTHPLQEAKKLAGMKTVDFDNLRVYRISTIPRGIKIGQITEMQLAYLESLQPQAVLVAQTSPAMPSSNGSNSPIQYLHQVLANINVSNALNNLSVLNNSNLNIPITLSNVLNNNKVAIGQVVGLYIGGGGIITTIIH